jgi:hypothetical protein
MTLLVDAQDIVGRWISITASFSFFWFIYGHHIHLIHHNLVDSPFQGYRFLLWNLVYRILMVVALPVLVLELLLLSVHTLPVAVEIVENKHENYRIAGHATVVRIGEAIDFHELYIYGGYMDKLCKTHCSTFTLRENEPRMLVSLDILHVIEAGTTANFS